MAVASETVSRSTRLADEILRLGEPAFNPERSVQSRSADEGEFNELISSTKTLALIQVLSTLIQHDRAPSWLKSHLVHTLALLPLRTRGVHDTIEFIFQVHPSTVQKTGTGQSQTAESRGPGISLEALNAASRLISSPPSDFSADAWFSAIAPQLFALLDGEGGLELVKAASFIVGYGILGRKALGAPGTPGWKSFAEPILSRIDPTLTSHPFQVDEGVSSNEDVIYLRAQNVITTDLEVAEALRRLVSLLSLHPNPGLSKRLLDSLLLPLWSLSSWVENVSDQVKEQFCAPAKFLLQILLQLASTSTQLLTIVRNMLYQGNRNSREICWTYASGSAGGIQVEKSSSQNGRGFYLDGPNFDIIDKKVEAFIELVRPSKDDDSLPALFLSLCKEWLLSTSQPSKSGLCLERNDESDYESLVGKILVAKSVQKMLDAFPERLIGDSGQMLHLADGILHKAVESGENLDSDDTVAVALSLLNTVFMSKSFGNQSEKELIAPSLRTSLELIATKNDVDVSITARNLLLLLQLKAAEPVIQESQSITREKGVEDKKIYSLALSYLTGADSPPPVRAQGLDLVFGLITTSSPVLDVPATLILLSSLLRDDEEYIYLRVTKAFVAFSVKHPKAVMLGLLERYIDVGEDSDLDSRLRLGESLLQVVENAGETFAGELAKEVGRGLLTIASRRGSRPKRHREQERKAAASRRKNLEAEEAWDGPVPQLEDDNDALKEDPILFQIIKGWDSKMGTEDIRIRTSALSIFGSAIETNIAGLGSSLISTAVDLSVNILALESEYEKAILRRAAILLIMSLVRALDGAQERSKNLGFGFAGESLEEVLGILRYISKSDNDGLVRRHAEDVIEGLATWQMKSLLPIKYETRTDLDSLVGLSIGSGGASTATKKPTIEEIE